MVGGCWFPPVLLWRNMAAPTISPSDIRDQTYDTAASHSHITADCICSCVHLQQPFFQLAHSLSLLTRTSVAISLSFLAVIITTDVWLLGFGAARRTANSLIVRALVSCNDASSSSVLSTVFPCLQYVAYFIVFAKVMQFNGGFDKACHDDGTCSKRVLLSTLVSH
jgi:hypothetical protein